MQTRKSVSVIVPVYQAEDTVTRCVDSILAAMGPEDELILVDDGSKDGSVALCQEAAERDSRIRLIRQKNSGSGAARNNGIDHAGGYYVLFVDADDWVEPDIISTLTEAAEQRDCDIVICSHNIHFTDGTVRQLTYAYQECGMEESHRAIFRISKAPWGKLYKKELLDRYGIRFPEQRRAQDVMFNFEYFDHVRKCALLDSVCYHYQHNNLVSFKKKFPDNIFEMYVNAVDFMYQCAQKWNLVGDVEIEEIIGNFLMNALDKCLAVSILGEYSPEQRRNILNGIIHHRILGEAFGRFHSGSAYHRLLKALIRLGNPAAIVAVVKLKYRIRNQTSY
ncbi:MAG: glycosyltransferase family 2 protein [Oscillibacter sp.]|nr:glycosyltransferase family 2 protein [Oscillibacter sp.]